MFEVSAAAWIGSLIPTVAYFHLISFSALGANLLAVPLAFGVLALGVLALLFGTFSLWVAGAFNNANWLVTKLLLLVVQGSALLPGGHWFVGPPGKPYPVMTLLDLRGASCAVIRSEGDFMLLDAGRKRDARATILPFLESSGANSVGSVLVTKADASHLGGLAEIMRDIRTRKIYLPPADGRSPVARKFCADSPEAVRAVRLKTGEEIPLGGEVTATILACAPEKVPDSVIVRVKMGDLRVLFLPRIDAGVLEAIAAAPRQELRADLLILPLGGSGMAPTLGVIRGVAPKSVISPVDALSRNGNPSPEWDGILDEEGIRLIRQDRTGAVLVEADPKAAKIVPFAQTDRPGSAKVGFRLKTANPGKPLIER